MNGPIEFDAGVMRHAEHNGSGSGFENGIKTMIEKVGEGEIAPTQ